MLTPKKDQQLDERVQRGDRRAFDLLVLKYQHKILGLIVRFVHDTHECSATILTNHLLRVPLSLSVSRYCCERCHSSVRRSR